MRRSAILLILLAPLARACAAPSAEDLRFFEARVRPLLVQHCQECHGPKKKSGGLRLDFAGGLRAGGDNGPVIDSSTPQQSLLLRAVRHEGPKMPPKKKLPAADIDALARWVKMGAPWPAEQAARPASAITAADRAFWAFQPVRDPPVPAVRNADWPRNWLDHFLLAKMEARGLSPSAPADRRTLIRRVTFDLIGLPPTPEEVTAFVNDTRPDAYKRLVERLLASPAYGERWGRHWLDVVRYADTAGDNSDYPVPQAYRYRNWVIAGFNADRPYNLFLQEQIAGDLMPGQNEQETFDRIVATGYLAGTRRFGSYEDKRYQWYLTFEDSIENLGRTVLGLGLGCARCHDHKFDPISMEDYYALYGIFRSTRYPWPGIELDKVQRDLVPLVAPIRVEEAMKERKRQLDELDRQYRELDLCEKVQRRQNRQKRDALAKNLLPIDYAYAVVEGKRWVGNAYLQFKGDPARPGKEVPRRFLSILGGQTLPPGVSGSGRLQLAAWLTDEKNPLTARVLVNRLWLHHFGRGLVSTPNDFGKQGQPPSHAELLDALAMHLVRSGWSIKAMHRLMVLSSAYRQASDEPIEADPNNLLLSRFNRRRLDAEAIRDTLLVLGGALDHTPGGPHPFPEQRTWDFTQHKPFKAVYDTDRRSVYLMTQRIQRHPYLALFDGADTNASTAWRTTSTTPLQALYLMNDPFAHRLARGFAARLQAEATGDRERIERSFLLAFARQPTRAESDTAQAHLEQMRSRLQQATPGEPEREARLWEAYARAVFMSNELVYVD
jgi:mono/diheme cytochrome c family protein